MMITETAGPFFMIAVAGLSRIGVQWALKRLSTVEEDTMQDAVIVGAVRTAVGKRNGKLSGVRPDDLIALVLQELVARVKIDPAEVEDVILGCVDQVGEQGFNIARNAALIAGFPLDVCGTTLDRMCGSGQQAANFAAMGVMAGQYDCVIAGGVEHMTRVPMGSNGAGPGEGPISPKLSDRYAIIPQGLSAEMIAEKWGLTREEIDEFSAGSHEKAGRAIAEGHFTREIMPVALPDGSAFDTDEGVRVPVNREKMASLQPSFKSDGVVTAGNSSQISDGAAALLIMSEARAKALGLTPRARIVATALAGVDPTIMLTGPIPATQRVLKKADMKLDRIDLIEINEAFASVVLAWERELHPDMTRVNVNGGAIALGHPLGASGAKLMTTLLHELERTKKRYALQTMCIGMGQGIATIIERL
jgi:acetyl-CoA acetyltransferase family protein